MSTRTAACLCGQVQITATPKANVSACSCGSCRKWVGGPFMAIACGTEVQVQGEIKVFASSAWAERAFCPTCGSALFYRLKANQQHMLAAGLFEDQSGFVLDHQVFVDKNPGWYSFEQETKDMTEAEIFARFGG